MGIAESVTSTFCQIGRLERNAIAAPIVIKVISERRPAHASATFNVRSAAFWPSMNIFVPLKNAFTPDT